MGDRLRRVRVRARARVRVMVMVMVRVRVRVRVRVWWMAVTVPSEGERRVTHAPCWCIGQSGVGGRAAKASGAKLASCSAETWV